MYMMYIYIMNVIYGSTQYSSRCFHRLLQPCSERLFFTCAVQEARSGVVGSLFRAVSSLIWAGRARFGAVDVMDMARGRLSLSFSYGGWHQESIDRLVDHESHDSCCCACSSKRRVKCPEKI